MADEVNDDINDTILQAEESILRIAEELGRMKAASEQLDEAGKRSQLLQDAVENLVIEIGSLVELSGRVIEVLNASEIRGLVTQMRTVLSRRMDGLRTELLENTKSSAERVSAELQTVLVQHIDSLGTEITARTEAATGRAGTELRGALVQRIDSLENELTIRTRSGTEQVSGEFVAASERWMTDNDEILKRLDALGLQISEVRDLAENSSKRKGLFL